MAAPVVARTNLAIVGFGRWGRVLVASVQGKSKIVQFATAVSRDPTRIAADAEVCGIKVVDALTDVLADVSIKGVVLASPHSIHADQIQACVAAGKAVMAEKPVTLTWAAAKAAFDAAERAGVLVAAAHNRRFLRPVAELKAMIEAGELGTILHTETNFSANAFGRFDKAAWRIAPGESPAGGMAGLGIHQIDAIIFLQGLIDDVYAITRRRIHEMPLDDTTVVSLRLKSGATASLLTMTATVPTYRIQVFGTKAKAEINGDAETRGSETLVITGINGISHTRLYEPFDIERAELEAFSAAIEGQAPYPIRTDEVLNGIAAFEAVSLSAERNMPIAIQEIMGAGS